LIPKKHSEIIKPTADKFSVEEQLVKHLVEAYWKDVRKSLVNCEGHNIVVAGLGTFIAKPWKVAEVIKMYQTVVDRYKQTIDSGTKISFQKFAHMKDSEKRIEVLQTLDGEIKQDQQRKKIKRTMRHEKNSQ
jgi:nucleoid DNA-binding protein